MSVNERNESIEFKLISRIGVIKTNQATGWSRELNMVSWNGGIPKYDIRDWNPEHTRMTRGLTLYEDEVMKLAEILGNMFPQNNRTSGVSGVDPSGGGSSERSDVKTEKSDQQSETETQFTTLDEDTSISETQKGSDTVPFDEASVESA